METDEFTGIMPFKQNKKGGKPQRTVDVSADGGHTQSMTPEAAARYLQRATSHNSNREVKISFGPSRPPSLEALKETAAREGLPCSEAEMKALMGMFVEIMGMGMDGKKGGPDSESTNKTGPLPMMFGRDGPGGTNWPDHETLAAATAGLFADGASWDAIRKTYGAVYQGSDNIGDEYDEYDGDENESIPDLDDMPNIDMKQAMAVQDWETMGTMAVADTLEAQERARKAARNREKKQRKKQKQREDAAAKAAEDAQRQRESEIMAWRSQVVFACRSQDVAQLDMLIDESPFLDDDDDDNDILPHLEYLLPYTLPKSRNHVENGKGIRCKLASYLLDEELHLAFEPMQNGRPILHAACFLGDLAMVELVLDKLEHYFQAHANDRHPFLAREDLDITCADAGWAALHYAAMSGSPQVLEVLLRAGCNVTAITDSSYTCLKSGRKGITAHDLIDCVKDGTYHDVLETHGLALQEIQKTFLENQNDRRIFSKSLENASKRIHEVEINGYIVPGLLGDLKGPSDGAKKRKKKKKKKQQGEKDSEATSETASIQASKASVPVSAAMEAIPEDVADPLVTALLAMGFPNDEILAAVKACGGSSQATADDLVTWILGQGADSNVVASGGGSSDAHSSWKKTSDEGNGKTAILTKVVDETTRAVGETRGQEEEAARRLAEKREERRRRNREWNSREQARQLEARTNMAPTLALPPPGSQHGLPPNIVSNPTQQSGVPTLPITPGLNSTIAPVATAKKAPRVSAAPPVKHAVPLHSSPLRIPDSEFPSLSESALPSNKPHPRKMGTSPVAPAHVMTVSNAFPVLGDDDRTVSSFGSNRGLSVSSVPFLPQGIAQPALGSVGVLAPPGMTQPLLAVGEHAWKTDLNETDIRVTAPEFVPTRSVTGGSQSQQNVASSLAPLSGNFHLEALLGSTRPQNRSSHASGEIPFSQSFLAPPSIAMPFLGGGPSQYERMPSATPLSEDTTTLSVGSSLTGIPGFDESSGVSSGAGTFGLCFDGQMQGASTTSLLSSSFTNPPPIGGDSLWGGLPPIHGSLGGLPPLNFGNTGLKRQDSSDAKDNLPQSWVAPGIGGGQGGSIW